MGMTQSLEDYFKAIYNLASGVKGESDCAVAIFSDLNLGLSNKYVFLNGKLDIANEWRC